MLGIVGVWQFVGSGLVGVGIAEEAIDGIDTVAKHVEAGRPTQNDPSQTGAGWIDLSLRTSEGLEGDVVVNPAFSQAS